ncbi:undecaprenyl-diphosphatase [Candidatus Marinamargulisbacteria bacterium SCGC AAA071-K20]|nr:undecaprenyl-diphosphatase [Candidatus Marinamargulisbacteria bacterium SCGC AAA071-K20]
MSDIIKAIILGIVEGITEYIPISSTGHLIITGDFLTFTSANTETFSIAIQLGAILSVVFIYKDFFKEIVQPKNWLSKDMKMIAIAIFPALVSGFFLHSFIKEHLFSTPTVIWALFVGGIIMIIVEKFFKIIPTTTDVKDITAKQALIIGVSQCAALWPGMSRSGSTIVGGLFAKCDYDTSAKFSFIIAVPVMICAVGYDLLKSMDSLTMNDAQLIAIGFIVSFIVAIIAIRTFLKILSRLKLFPFAVYRIVFSAILFWSGV